MEQGYVQVGSDQIFYQVKGKGPDLVLLMGFGADGDLWEQHLEAYQSHFRCIVVDNRGVGRSSAPVGPYSTAMMADDTKAVMDHLQVDKALVAGISMGGAIAQELALRHPDRVKTLLLISTWSRFNQYATSVYENLKAVRKTALPGDFMALLQLWIFAPPYYESNYSDLEEGQKDAAGASERQTEAGFDGQLDACIAHDTVDRLSQIDVPTLITVGEMDIFTPPAFSEVLHEGIKNSSLERFPTGGHVHHWEDLERFNQLTTDFLLKNC